MVRKVCHVDAIETATAGRVVKAMELLAGQPPFVAPSAIDVMQKHWSQYPEPLDGKISLPARLNELCLWLLAKQPDERPPSAHAGWPVSRSTRRIPYLPTL